MVIAQSNWRVRFRSWELLHRDRQLTKKKEEQSPSVTEEPQSPEEEQSAMNIPADTIVPGGEEIGATREARQETKLERAKRIRRERAQLDASMGRHPTGAGRRRRSRFSRKVGKVMREFKHRDLYSSSGRKVKNRKQALAIALSEARRYT
jgi:hypothetical protein